MLALASEIGKLADNYRRRRIVQTGIAKACDNEGISHDMPTMTVAATCISAGEGVVLNLGRL